MINRFRSLLFYQHDKSDCGIACLKMILKYYNKDRSFEELRYLSGTTKDGTTLLGLYQCANKIGFIAEGCKGDKEELKRFNKPTILRVTKNDVYHYIVFFYYDNKINKYIIGDPADGIRKFNVEELDAIWKDGYCLTINPDKGNKDTNFYNKKDKRKYIIRLIAKDKRILFNGLFFSLIISILGLSFSIYSQQLVDNILPSKNFNKIIWSIIIFGVLLITRALFVYLKDILFSYQTKSFNTRINTDFYTKLLHLPKLFFNTRKIGDLVSRLNDVTKIQSIIYIFFNSYINDLLSIIISIIVIFFYSGLVGIIAACFIPVLMFIIIQKSRDIIQKQKEVQVYSAFTESNYISTITGISDIKNINRVEYFSRHNNVIFDSFQTKKFLLSRTYFNLNIIVNIISIIFIIVTTSISIYQIYIGILSVGDLIALLSISGLIISSTANLSLLFIPFTDAKISFDRMYSLMEIDKKLEKTDYSKLETISIINLENIYFKYPGSSKNLYENSNISLYKGEIVALTGKCGTGKTTLIDIITGNYLPDKGRVLYNKTDISSINKQDLSGRIRVVPQFIHIFEGSILYNIIMNDTIDIDKVNALTSKFGLDTFFKNFPQGINTMVGEEGLSLSGGQKKILGLFRALYDDPEVLVLDEPTASLDDESINFVYLILKEIKRDKVILLISHNTSRFDSIINRSYNIENSLIIKSK